LVDRTLSGLFEETIDESQGMLSDRIQTDILSLTTRLGQQGTFEASPGMFGWGI
jgi:hypothetical protein